jgi:fatty acid desaturase
MSIAGSPAPVSPAFPDPAAPSVAPERLARLTPSAPRETAGAGYAELKRLLSAKGLLDKQPVSYLGRIAVLSCLLVAGLVLLVLIHVVWLQLLDAAYLAVVCGQLGLLGHEAGHRQMFAQQWGHELVGLIAGTLLIGMSFRWWVGKHNRHHGHPNQVGMDPDIEIPFLDFTGTEDLTRLGSVRRFLVRHQAALLLPALMTVAIGLQASSVIFLARNQVKHARAEWPLLIAHFVLYFGLVFWCLRWGYGLLFIAIHQALTGFYLGSIFAPNHKGMPVLAEDSTLDWLHRQVLTARNIYAHPLTDFVYGGLNYQIEHHLFPTMARNKLRVAQPIIRTFCEAQGIPYHETSVARSFTEIFRHLYHVGDPLR